MKLTDWLVGNNQTATGLLILMENEFPSSPTLTALVNVIKGVKTPGLELGMMITQVTNNEVTLNELIPDGKRRYTEPLNPVEQDVDAELAAMLG